MKNVKFLLFLCVFLLSNISAVFASSHSYTDITATTRYREAILALSNANIFRGYQDGTFRPTASLKRAEIVKLIMESQNTAPATVTRGCFTDVQDSSQWYFRYLCTAKNLGIAQGYSDGSFQPGREVTRAEAITLLCRTQNWNPQAPAQTPFIDAKRSDWFTPCISYAKENNLLTNITGEARFIFPGLKMQRGAFAEILYRSLLKTGRTFEVSLDEKTSPEPLLIATAPSPGFTQVTDITLLQQELLQLTNNERTGRGLSTVAFSNELSSVAQGHSNHMVQFNFFDHVDQDGKTPDQRRMDAGVTTLVGENLAKAGTIVTAHEGLMNSPPHRENILTPNWERMGIGIAQDSEGYLFITELFSTNPLAASDLTAEKTRLFNFMNSKRGEAGIPALTFNAELNGIAESWSRDMAELHFFSLTHPNGETLINRVRNQFTATLYQMAIYESNVLEQFQEVFAEDTSRFVNAQYRKAGLGFAMDSTGILELTLILTD